MNKEVTIRQAEVKISRVSVNSSELSFLYTINVSSANITDSQEVSVVYPNGDDKYSISVISQKLNTVFERPVQVGEDFLNINPTAENPELLKQYASELKDICEDLNVFNRTFNLSLNITTTDYTEEKGGINIYEKKLFSKTLLNKNVDFKRFMQEFINAMKERKLVDTMANSDKKKSTGKVLKILDSLFPACNMEINQVEGSITESSSRIGKVLQKVKLSANGKFVWKLSTNPDIDFGLDTAVALVGTNTENSEQKVIFSYDTYPDYELVEETHLAYDSAPQEGEVLSGFKDVDDMINSVNEWQKTKNSEHVIVDNYTEPSKKDIDLFKYWVKEYSTGGVV